MQICNICKVKITTKTDRCPLCHNKLKMDNRAKETYPKYKPLLDKYAKSTKTVSIIATVLIFTSFILNLFVIQGSYWSVTFSIGITYFWLLGMLTFNRNIHLGIKLIGHAITVPLVLIIINMFATNNKIINDISWAISYATPLVIFCFITTITFIMIQRKHKLKDYLLYQFTLCLMGLIPLIIVLCGVAKPFYPSLIVALYSYTTMIYLIIFSKRQLKEELKKRFHL